MNKIGIVIDKRSALQDFLLNNLREVFGNTFEFSFYYINKMENIEEMDLILVMIKERILNIISYVKDTTKILPVKRTITRDTFEKLKSLRNYSEVLVVNDTVETTMELIATFYELGLNNIRFIPYNLGDNYDDIPIAVTANEAHLVPNNIKCIDIGYRPLDISTYIEILSRLDMPFQNYHSNLEKYDSKYISQEKNALNSIKLNKTVEKLTNALKSQSKQKGFYAQYTFDSIITESKDMLFKMEKAKKLAKHDINVLIYGESGTGKELFSQAIHNYSNRKNLPFIGVNVTAIPPNLLESEFFGYAEGAFTGAKKGGHKGIFEKCSGGTLFLDEIGDMSLDMQGKLLRVLEEKCIMPVGAHKFIDVDVRIIAATNKDLKKEILKGTFREDLYYRLKAAVIRILPLRERMEDFHLLSRKFLDKKDIKFSKEALRILTSYGWYGNVRELKNVCSYINIMDCDEFIDLDDIPDDILEEAYEGAYEDIGVYDDSEEKNIYISSDKILVILKSIKEISKISSSVGRKSIKEHLNNLGVEIGEGEIKGILAQLKENGLIIQQRGRKGAILTLKGENMLKGQ